jgi:Clp amino terminal domain, pathogenicity island component/UvrB/uvrC motif
MFERFNNQARRAVVLSQQEAQAFNHNYIGSEHLLLGLLGEDAGAAARALASVNVTLDAARQELETISGRGKTAPSGHIPFTPGAKKSMEISLREAEQLGDHYIGTGHLLLGLIRQDDSTALRILSKLGTDPKDLRERVILELRERPERTDGVKAPDEGERQATVRQRIGMRPRDQIIGLMDTIEERLTAIERHLGIDRGVPDELRSLDERIAEVRRDKEAAIDAQDFDRAVGLRDTEKRLLWERARIERAMQAGQGNGAETDDVLETAEGPGKGEGAGTAGGTGTGEVSGTGGGAGGPDEVARLQARLARYEAQLREHDIDPDEPEDPPAATG